MTIDELKEAIAAKEAESAALRAKIQVNTDAARKLNEENRTMISERREVEKAKSQLEHELRKAEHEAKKQPEQAHG